MEHTAAALLGLLLVMAGVCVITFIISHLIPGDPARLLAGDRASDEMVRHIRQQLGLDLPLWQQFIHYVGDLLQGDPAPRSAPAGRCWRISPSSFRRRWSWRCAPCCWRCWRACRSACCRRSGAIAGSITVRLLAITGISTPAFWLGLGAIVLFYGHLNLLPGGGRLDDWLDPPTHVTGLYLIDALLAGDGEVFSTARNI